MQSPDTTTRCGTGPAGSGAVSGVNKNFLNGADGPAPSRVQLHLLTLIIAAATATMTATAVAATPAEVRAANEVVAEWAAVDQAISQAQARLAAAEQALKAGRTPLPGERRGNVNGTSRLTPAYFERIASLENDVAQARAELDAAYAQRRTLPSRNYQGPVQRPSQAPR